MRSLTIYWLLLCVVQLSVAQHPSRIYQSHSEENGVFRVQTNDGHYVFQFYTPEILETSFIPKGEVSSKASHAVVLTPQQLKTRYTYVGNTITYASSGLSVNITTSPFQVSYQYKGKNITAEKLGYHKKGSSEAISFHLDSNEVLYGGGARALGMNRRGYKLQLYNKAHYGYETHSELMNFTLPIVVSSNQYLIHFDNAPIGYLDLDSQQNNTLTYETISGRKTYQIVVGDSWTDLVYHYTQLTGTQPLPPRWAFGNFSSRFGYHSQNETEATIQKFNEEEIPVDAIILDLYWFGKTVQGTMGNLAVDTDSFPDMKGMVQRLNAKGVQTVLITEPFVLTTSKRWDEAIKNDVLAKDSLGNPFTYDFYFGNTGLIDIYNPKGKQWFWNIYKELIDSGVKGVWGDLGEPEVHPSKLLHTTGTADEVHNTYGHDWARLIYEGYQKDYPLVRPFILMRAGYSGSQRFGLIPWSGDVNRTWGGLQSQPKISLQMGMQGLGYMHSDLGGFAGANLDDELYVRWLQYGVFQPIFRPHAQDDVPSEPVFRSDKAKYLAKKAIALRYQFLPYNYQTAFENSQKGTPLMRPLFFEEPNNTSLDTLSSTYLWGKDVLVTPILKADQAEVAVYFPKDHAWFDFYSDERVEGGQTATVFTNPQSIPTYVRAGAFLLMAPPMQTTQSYTGNDLVVHYYHDASIVESERSFYNDDGKLANAFKKGAYEIMEFEAEVDKKWLAIEFEAEQGNSFVLNPKNITLIVHNITWDPKKIKVNGKRVSAEKKENTIRIPIPWNPKKKVHINISLN